MEPVTFLSRASRFRVKLKPTFVRRTPEGRAEIERGLTIETKNHKYVCRDPEILKLLRMAIKEATPRQRKYFWEYKPTPIKDQVKELEDKLERLKKQEYEETTGEKLPNPEQENDSPYNIEKAPEKFPCPYCGRVFTDRIAMIGHKRWCKENPAIKAKKAEAKKAEAGKIKGKKK